jgi:O-antigen/teichoic acid export membrane protein
LNHSGVESILRNAGYLVGAQGITSLARGIYAVVLAVFLGPELYGLFNYGLSWYLVFLPLGFLGLDAIVGREIGRDRVRGARIARQALALRTLAAIGAAGLSCAVAWSTESATEMRWLLLLFSLALFGRSLAIWTNGVFTAYEAARFTLRQEAVFRLLEVALGSTVLAAGGGLLMVTAVHAMTWWLQGVRGLALVRRHLGPLRPDWNGKALLALLAAGGPLGLAEILRTWLLQGPLLLFRHVNGVGEALGELALAMHAFVILGMVGWAVGAAGLPVLSRTVVRADGKDRLFVKGMLRAGLLSGAVAGLAGMALGPGLVPLLFGTRYAETGTLLGPALWLLVPLSWRQALSQTLLAHGRVWPQVASAALGALAMTLSMPVLAARLGGLGALLAAGLGFGVSAVALLAALRRGSAIDLAGSVLRPALAVLMSVGTYLALRPVHPVVALAASVGILAAGMLLLGVLAPGERDALGKILRKLTMRRHA